MPTRASADLPPPSSWDEFETIVADLVREVWHDPATSEYGRTGQAQQGVDIYCRLDGTGYCGFQCKNTNSLDMDVINEEIEKADSFSPSLSKFVVATTAPQDASLQEEVRELSEEREEEDKFPVDILMWEDISRLLGGHQNLLETHYPQFIYHQNKLSTQGFTRLSPKFFESQSIESIKTCWQVGFNLAEIREYSIDRTYTNNGSRVHASNHLIDLLQSDDLAVLGLPGSGKSTICKKVAVDWYEDLRGDVFYRTGSTPQKFGNRHLLIERIEEANGEVLVVVEDAMDVDADDVFHLIDHFKNNPQIHFLLESRKEDWDSPNQYLQTARHKRLQSTDIHRYDVPELDLEEIERLVQKFSDLTDVDEVIDPQTLRDRIKYSSESTEPQGVVAGEMFYLSYYLSRILIDPQDYPLDGSEPFASSLTNDVENTAQELHEEDQTKIKDQFGLLINLLNVSGIDFDRSLVYSLADSNGDFREISDIFKEVKGKLIFGKNEEILRTRHPYWSYLYLNFLIESNTDRFRDLIEDCLNSLFDYLVSEPRQDRVARFSGENSPILSQFDDIGDAIYSLAEHIFNVGVRYPKLSDLFHQTEYSEIRLPNEASDRLIYDIINWRGLMYLRRGELNKAKNEFEYLVVLDDELIDNDLKMQNQALGSANLGTIYMTEDETEKAFYSLIRAGMIYWELEDVYKTSNVFGSLGLFAKNYGLIPLAERLLGYSIAGFEEIGDIAGVAQSLHNLGKAALRRNDYITAEKRILESLELNKQLDNRYGIANNLGALGLIDINRGNFDKAYDRFTRAFQIFDDIGDKNKLAEVGHSIGKTAAELGNLDQSERYLREAKNQAEEVGNPQLAADCLLELGKIKKQSGNEEEAEQLILQSQDIYQQIGNNKGVLEARFAIHGLESPF
jgi:tetratricopeptide (TPR) repeat protein